MNALVVSVNFSDLLRLTLPYMRHHFDRYLIVTDLDNYNEVTSIAQIYEADVFGTDSFYSDGCPFRKWQAVEDGLDQLGREGWLCIMDIDITWPKELPNGWMESLQIGKLYTPFRRMYPTIPDKVPNEETWKSYPIHRNVNEHASYSHIFHADDPVAKNRPWYDTSWKHCGGADSFYQARWSPKNKIRPSWECLHYGESGQNWAGRISRMQDGSLPPNYQKHKKDIDLLQRSRQQRRGYDNPIEKIM